MKVKDEPEKVAGENEERKIRIRDKKENQGKTRKGR